MWLYKRACTCVRNRLAAAIPAVIAYNKFAGDLERVGARMETFAEEFSTLLARQLDEGGR